MHASDYPLIQSFVDFSNTTTDDSSILVSTDDKLNEVICSNVSSFRSLNQEFIWCEALEGWVKAQKPTIANFSATPQFKASDDGFLKAVANIACTEMEDCHLTVNQLKKLEAGLDVTYLSTMVPGGQFIALRILFFFQKGRISFLRKNHSFNAKMCELISFDTTENALDNIMESHLELKASFLQNKPVIWLQFSSTVLKFLKRLQKFIILVFNDSFELKVIEKVTEMILSTSFLKFLKSQKKKKL
ncbi:uncharacterized protein LOC128883386 [Hylaeus volcanicus]|uniref:uncharacterized protein LOC128883386 n=1 Tax=Hylaeus volcanicus TaxID=313075 RepID=UPI0023B84C53|nr:uncharacterized protein LOC128883386 [Hylaeus volcanicus]